MVEMGSIEDSPEVGQGAFRSTALRAICAVCGEPTSGESCVRCAAPLCAAHTPPFSSRRCSDCELAYDVLLRDRRQHPISLLMLFGCYIVAVAGALVAVWLFPGSGRWFGVVDWTLQAIALLVVVLALAGMPLYLSIYRRRRLRGIFLRERPDSRRATLSPATLRAERMRLAEIVPYDDLATGALALSIVFCVVPLLGLMGGVLGLYVFLTPEARETRRWKGRAVAAVIVSHLASSVIGWLIYVNAHITRSLIVVFGGLLVPLLLAAAAGWRTRAAQRGQAALRTEAQIAFCCSAMLFVPTAPLIGAIRSAQLGWGAEPGHRPWLAIAGAVIGALLSGLQIALLLPDDPWRDAGMALVVWVGLCLAVLVVTLCAVVANHRRRRRVRSASRREPVDPMSTGGRHCR
jgi:hypothetical protein